MPETIRHKLSLAVRLIDATDGQAIESAALFTADGKPIRPLQRPNGHHIFLSELQADFTLEIKVAGYEKLHRKITHSELDPKMPVLLLELIPVARQTAKTFWSLEGVMKGLTAIDAIKLGENSCLMRDFDSRKRIITIFNPHRLELARQKYALVNPDALTYEVFSFKSRLSDKTFKIDTVLADGFMNHFPVTVVIGGIVDEGGKYLLRVRDDTTDSRWLVRFVTAQGATFKLVDFDSPEALESG